MEAGLLLIVQTIIVGLLAYVVIVLFLRHRERSKLPPGPYPLPIIGNLHLVADIAVHRPLQALARQYGNVYSLVMGCVPNIVLNDYAAIQEAFVGQADCFTGRPHFAIHKEISGGAGGFLNGDGSDWMELRKFTLRCFRGFGVGRRSQEGRIHEELRVVIEHVSREQERPFDIFNHLKSATGTSLLSTFAELDKFLEKRISQHKETFDPNNIRDIIDAFLVERNSCTNRVRTAYLLYNELVKGIHDLFLAGTETTSNTLYWFMLFMLHHPHVQAKVQEEIDSIVGHGRLPSMSDRANMPYTEAAITEMQRLANIVPIVPPHRVTRDTVFRGWHVPADTCVMANLRTVLGDGQLWPQPEQLRPERFLSSDRRSFIKREEMIAFGTGPRVCAGEALAKMQLFLFFTTLLQRFTFTSPPGLEAPSLEPQWGIVYSAKPFKLCATERDWCH
ncbi:PREDICTED: cytochrome P450 2J5-like [Priapulus caudatus]|uniref:Cytochrome P450 2J5-like n=1 Tax=Priapulus caudatus TaxID=37621 RepID=A0ABM1F9T0_PRICU|nr:PREDICTED: cytochrome P450 2J5-like [Priapulus caudatus]